MPSVVVLCAVMSLSEFLTLVLLLFPGILLSLILMATFAAGG
ncbi:hypothetical protein [Synechococcus sp. B60.2]